MTITPLTDQQLADGQLLDLIQAEVDSKPPHYYRFNGGLYVPKVLPLAQALRADRDRLVAELQRANANRSELADQLSSANEAEDELEAELGRVRAELATTAAIFEFFGRVLATSSRDWTTHPVDAWLWAVICGWDCEQPEHDDVCVHGAMEEMVQLHGWDDETVTKARCYREAVRSILAAPAASPSA